MKTIKNEYYKLYQYKNLYKAYKQVRIGKSKFEKTEFKQNLVSNIAKLQEDIKNEEYEVGKYRIIVVKEPKVRLIMSISYRDKILQRCLCDEILAKLIDDKVIYDNVAAQKEKGTMLARNRIKYFLRDYYNKNGCNGYYLKCDISKYFYNINHDILKQNLYKYIKDKKIIRLLDKIIDSTNNNELIYQTRKVASKYSTKQLEVGKGLPIGNMTSQYFGVFYLSGLDRFIKEELKIKYYTRYVDDFILIHKDKKYLKYCLQEIENYLSKNLKLELNKKTNMDKLKNGIEYIGFRYYLKETGRIIIKLSNRNKKQTKRNIKKYKDLKIKEKQIKIKAWLNHAKYGNTYNLRKNVINRYNKDLKD